MIFNQSKMKVKFFRKTKFQFYPFLFALVIVLIVMIFLTWKFELHKFFATLLPILILSNSIDARPNGKDVCLEPGCVIAGGFKNFLNIHTNILENFIFYSIKQLLIY